MFAKKIEEDHTWVQKQHVVLNEMRADIKWESGKKCERA